MFSARFAFLLLFAPAVLAQTAPYLNPALSPAERAHDIVSRMTLDEKAQQLEDWAPAIPRLGVPDYQTWNEALHGVARAGYATVFPQAIGMAATWDAPLVHQMGDIISTEARAKYNQAQREGNHRIFYGLTFWSPNINIFRDPRWGRGQETYGEDPFLTGSMGTAFVTGVQGPDLAHPKAVATAKHFAVHSGPESQRHSFDVDPTPRDLEETYLAAFRATVVDGHVASVMCAYNAIDGKSACANTMLLKDHLRDAWGFRGFVVSDCGAIVDVTHGHHDAPDILHASAISLAAGTDLSCSMWDPGFNTLSNAVRQGVVPEALVTLAAERLYTARYQLGLLGPKGAGPYDSIPFSEDASDAHRAVALQAAEESMVLLKNNGILPFEQNAEHAPARLAVVGPTADLLPALEGNYNGVPLHPVTPLDGVKQQFAGSTITYAQGSTLAAGVEVPVPRTAFTSGSGAPGLKAEYFNNPDWSGNPVATANASTVQYDWHDAYPVPEITTHGYSVRWSGQLTAPAAGAYRFIVEPGDSFPYSPKESFRFLLDGKVLAEASLNTGKAVDTMGAFTFSPGSSPTAPPIMAGPHSANISVTLADTKPHDFRLEYSHSGEEGGGLLLKWQAPADAQLNEAVAVAKNADAVIAFVGLSPQLEGEEMPIKIEGFAGGDRTSIDLPAAQQKLLEAVSAMGKPVIVVSLSGSALALGWARDHAAAVLQSWYPGVAGGEAIARTLAGLNNPAGRLPVTFYAGTGDLPPFTDYSMKSRTYRYYAGTPLWGFGYGLSYSSFRYGALRLSSRELTVNEPLRATVHVTNTSKRAGDEVVEAYVKTPQAGGPIHALAGFERVHLAAGESRDVALTLNPRSLSSVDDGGNRSLLAGIYQITIAGAQPQDAPSKAAARFTVRSTHPLSR